MRNLLAALWLIALGCGQSKFHTLGTRPEGATSSISSVIRQIDPGTVSIRGILVEKCPMAGCWFYVKDPSGQIKVDTKTAGFVISEIPLGREIVVSGNIAAGGGAPLLEAIGVSYQ